MLRLFSITALVAATLAASPALASQNGGGTIGRGCTLDPFNHTMRCIDFDHCTIDKNGRRTCPVVVTSTRFTADDSKKTTKPKDTGKTTYLVVTLDQVLVSST
jgi:hypothetical protein